MEHRLETLLVHAGSEPDTVTGAVTPAISMATTFAQTSLGKLNGVHSLNSHGKGFEYSRTGNPTRGAFERAIAIAEHASHGIAFASGLAATNAIIQTLSKNDHVLCIDDVYGGTQRLFRKIVAPNSGIEFDFVDMALPVVSIAGAMKPNTKLVWLETPTNPTLKITDIRAVAAAIRAIRDDVWLVVDNTFMSPYLQNPLDLGAHIVIHSVTKYIGGHSDVVMGAICCNSQAINDQIRFVQNGSGAVPSPFDCFLALRGLKTLHVRMNACQSNAMSIALYLESHPLVAKCVYPGLKSHPNHQLASSQARGYGAMITFYLNGGLAMASAFLSSLQLFILAESLGAVESLAESPAIMTHASVPADKRAELGISDNMVRLSIGIEHESDLLDDLKQALTKAQFYGTVGDATGAVGSVFVEQPIDHITNAAGAVGNVAMDTMGLAGAAFNNMGISWGGALSAPTSEPTSPSRVRDK